jgi:hypothetical protein
MRFVQNYAAYSDDSLQIIREKNPWKRSRNVSK